MRDLRRIGAGPQLRRLQEGLHHLGDEDADLDVKPLRGEAPWLRLRIGDYRVLYRPIAAEESTDGTFLVARIVHRRDLQRAVATLE